jgi:hypothetical protein
MKISRINPMLLCGIMFSLIGMTACTKDVRSNAPVKTTTLDADTVITDTSIFIDFTIGNDRIFQVQNANNPNTWYIVWGISPADSTVYPYNRLSSAFTSPGANFTPSLEFSKGNVGFHRVGSLPLNFTDSFFAAGNYSYSVKTADTTYNYIGTATDTLTLFSKYYTKTKLSDGINILYYDSLGTAWETFNGTADQTGSSFTVLSAQPINNGNTTGKPIGALVTATFDCMLYDNKGNSKHLTKGRFRQAVYY